jgi:BirA family biotin operon repressor/biotin-[acetyl-CoA-carboxylase] ligase
MNPSEIHAPAIAWRIEELGEVISTNDLALDRARQGEPEGLVIRADSQTKGRGRLGRSWLSPPEFGLYFSALLRPLLPGDQLAALSLVCAVAIAEGLEEIGGIQAGLKWPNDIRLGGKKIAGILLEYESSGAATSAVIAGVGLNLKSPSVGYPDEFASRTTSMEAAGCRLPPEGEILRALLNRLDLRYRDYLDSGFESLRKRWELLSDGIGGRVSISIEGGQMEGTMRGIDGAGRLILDTGDGELHSIDTGEIIES